MAIVPDTKDWTWVLQRPCPECGFDAATAATDVAGRLLDATSRWDVVLRRDGIRQRPATDVWSPLEYACHVRDVFVLYLERATVRDALDTAGGALATRFDGVGGDQWQRTGRRSDGASFTIDSFSRYLLHDVVHHLHDVDG